MILNAFEDFKQTLSFYEKSSTFDNSNGTYINVETLKGSFKCIFYLLSTSQRFKYSKIDADISAMMIIDPALPIELNKNMFVIFEDKKYFFTFPDNILSLGEVVEIPCKVGG